MAIRQPSPLADRASSGRAATRCVVCLRAARAWVAATGDAPASGNPARAATARIAITSVAASTSTAVSADTARTTCPTRALMLVRILP
jgi:hypothetical protein